MHFNQLFTVAKRRRTRKHSLRGEWMMQMCYRSTFVYFSVLKKKESLSYKTTQINLGLDYVKRKKPVIGGTTACLDFYKEHEDSRMDRRGMAWQLARVRIGSRGGAV